MLMTNVNASKTNPQAPAATAGPGPKAPQANFGFKKTKPRTVLPGRKRRRGISAPKKTKPRTVLPGGACRIRCFSTCDQRAKSSRAPLGFLRMIVRVLAV
jgi:hypothetical protein